MILEELEIKKIIAEESHNPWALTVFKNYKSLTNKSKGKVGEKIVEKYMIDKKHKVINSIGTGYDRIIDGIKTEIKFSLAQTDTRKKTIKPDVFMLNHISIHKDWERLIFLGINLDESYYIKYMTKESFKKALETGNYFNYQQGGSALKNDDYMISNKKLIQLLNSKYMFDIDNW